jgi:hypothetical protein
MRSKHFKKHVLIIFILVLMTGVTGTAFAAPPLRLSPNNLADGTQYEPYSETLTGNGGTSPYFWNVTGTLPPGLSLTAAPSPSLTAVLSGNPTVAGTYTFTVTITDSGAPADSDSNTYTITVAPGNCTFVGSNTGSISFNIIDPSTTPGPILGTITQQIQITCKSGLAFTVAANPASGWTMDSGANSIAYTPGFIASGTGLCATPIDLLTTSSQILQADYMNAVGGAYANTQAVNLTVSWTTAGGGSIIASLPAGGVSGTVINTCAVFQAPGTLTFNIDPSVSGVTTATISPDMQLMCTRNSSVAVTASSACGGMDSAYPACGGSKIPYAFNYLTSITGQGFGTAVPLNISGSATSANYENAPVGAYGDLQTLTITY